MPLTSFSGPKKSFQNCSLPQSIIYHQEKCDKTFVCFIFFIKVGNILNIYFHQLIQLKVWNINQLVKTKVQWDWGRSIVKGCINTVLGFSLLVVQSCGTQPPLGSHLHNIDMCCSCKIAQQQGSALHWKTGKYERSLSSQGIFKFYQQV